MPRSAAAADVAAMADRYDAPKYDVRARLLRGLALARRPAERSAAVTELREAARRAEEYGFAALAEQAHRRAGRARLEREARPPGRSMAGPDRRLRRWPAEGTAPLAPAEACTEPPSAPGGRGRNAAASQASSAAARATLGSHSNASSPMRGRS